MRRMVTLLSIFGLLLVVAGCGGGGGGGNNDAAVRDAVATRIAGFKAAVEGYNVQGMLGFLDETNFTLTIAENNISYDKTYVELKEELEADEAKQLHWRKPVDQGGHGYRLTMELGTITYSNLSESGAIAAVPFTIWEEADGIAKTLTDTGGMVCELVKLQGQWLCRKMTINFNPPQGMSVKSAASGMKGARNDALGFGYGELGF